MTLFITGLTPTTDEGALLQLFAPFGYIASTRVLRNEDRSSRCIGFMVFKNVKDAEAAMTELQWQWRQWRQLHEFAH